MQTAVLAAVLWLAAVAALPEPVLRVRRPQPSVGTPKAGADLLRRPIVVRSAAGLAALALVVLVGGWPGWLLGALALASGPSLLRRFTTRTALDSRVALERQTALVADLLAACLASGAPLPVAMRTVAKAIGPPAEGLVGRAGLAASLGAAPSEVAAVLRGSMEVLNEAGPARGQAEARADTDAEIDPSARADEGLVVLAEAIERSSRTGAPLVDLLVAEAGQLRTSWLESARTRVRSVVVASVLPLALCFLPAFVLLGIVPVVAGLLGHLW